MIDVVVKVGGSLTAHPEWLDPVLTAITGVARERPLLVVPGGGPFADAVRDVAGSLRVSRDAAHWMAILGMDQYAHLIAERMPGAALARSPGEIQAITARRGTPVLAPYDWLHDADPLPHSWHVTSDSIAAWVAGQLGARRIVLVKAPGATGDLRDSFFESACPPGVAAVDVPADSGLLRGALMGSV